MDLLRRWLVPGAGIIVVGLGALWWSRQPPPGEWPAERTLEQMRRGWAKEQEWANQPFTPIRDDPSFLEAVSGIPVRMEIAISQEQLQALQRILYDQLVCRHTGSLECYRERFAIGRRGPLDESWILRIKKVYPSLIQREWSENWSREEVFEQFWNAEYNRIGSSRRFAEVALGPAGALLVISEVRSAPYTESAMNADEIKRWRAWPGTWLYASTLLHGGERTLAAIVEKYGKAVYAESSMILRSGNREIWSWFSDWYLDPVDERWQVHTSGTATSRHPYNVPM